MHIADAVDPVPHASVSFSTPISYRREIQMHGEESLV